MLASQNPPDAKGDRLMDEIAPPLRPGALARLVRRKRFWAILALPPLTIAGVAGWLTEPLEATNPEVSTRPKLHAVARPAAPRLAPWPDSAISGRPAMTLLLDSLRDAKARLIAARGYTAVLSKTERIDGKLGAEQVLEMKCRNEPFGVYFKFRTPEPGKEVVYSAGHYDDCVIAHGTGFSRRLVPRLKVAPTSAIAMSGNRHPITEAGLLNLTNRLIGFREMDLSDPEAETTLDRVRDDSGREWLRSVHTHPHQKPERPFGVVEVLYDPETRIPVHIKNYDWLTPGEAGPPKLAETYRYDDLKLGAELSDADFDPANPAYGFSRF